MLTTYQLIAHFIGYPQARLVYEDETQSGIWEIESVDVKKTEVIVRILPAWTSDRGRMFRIPRDQINREMWKLP